MSRFVSVFSVLLAVYLLDKQRILHIHPIFGILALALISGVTGYILKHRYNDE